MGQRVKGQVDWGGWTGIRVAPLLRLGIPVLVSAVLAACSDEIPQPTATFSAARSPTPPPVPAGWIVHSDEAGELALALPAEFERVAGFPGVVAQLPSDPGVFGAEVHASVVRAFLPERPFTVDVVAAWLQADLESWARPGSFEPSGVQRVELPAGEAIELRGDVRTGGDPPSIQVRAYGFARGDAIVQLQVFATPAEQEARSSELALIPMLLTLSDR